MHADFRQSAFPRTASSAVSDHIPSLTSSNRWSASANGRKMIRSGIFLSLSSVRSESMNSEVEPCTITGVITGLAARPESDTVPIPRSPPPASSARPMNMPLKIPLILSSFLSILCFVSVKTTTSCIFFPLAKTAILRPPLSCLYAINKSSKIRIFVRKAPCLTHKSTK